MLDMDLGSRFYLKHSRTRSQLFFVQWLCIDSEIFLHQQGIALWVFSLSSSVACAAVNNHSLAIVQCHPIVILCILISDILVTVVQHVRTGLIKPLLILLLLHALPSFIKQRFGRLYLSFRWTTTFEFIIGGGAAITSLVKIHLLKHQLLLLKSFDSLVASLKSDKGRVSTPIIGFERGWACGWINDFIFLLWLDFHETTWRLC